MHGIRYAHLAGPHRGATVTMASLKGQTYLSARLVGNITDIMLWVV